MKTNFSATFESPRGPIFILDLSKRCEPSAFLFFRAVKFFDTNGYVFTDQIDRSCIILVNMCRATQDKISLSRSALDFSEARSDVERIVLFGCLAGLDVPGVVLFLNYSDNRGTPDARIFSKVSETEVRRCLDSASGYTNHHKPGRSAVIRDFNYNTPYNIRRQ